MSDEATRKLELLKMARTIVNEEYINRRAEEHNRWVALNDHTLRTTKIRAPYPPFTPYPSEEVIIAKALALYNFISPPALAATEPVPVIDEVAPVEETAQFAVEEPVPEEIVPEEESAPILEEHILPGWVKGWIRK